MINSENFSVVVITRNRPEILAQCLSKLAQQDEKPQRVIVVDSSDRFIPITEDGLLHLHFPGGKGQMPKARNRGAEAAETEWVAFIDDDCLVDSDWLLELVKAIRSDPGLAGVGGRISDPRWTYNPANPVGRVVQGRVYSNFAAIFDSIIEADIAPGGNMSFRKSWLEKVGGFDPRYVATNHREDPDLCLRIKQAGGRIGYCSSAHAHHLNARHSLGELKPWHEFYLRYSFGRNEAFFLARHCPSQLLSRWWEDTLSQASRAWKARSLVAGLCVIVQACSFGIGLISFASSKHRQLSLTKGVM